MLGAALAATPLLAAVLLGVSGGGEPEVPESPDAQTADPAAAWITPAPARPGATGPSAAAGPATIPPSWGTERPEAAEPGPGDAQDRPEAPAGHRTVAVSVVDAAAASLVRPQDRVDVVGLDGTVIAPEVQVLQVRQDEPRPVIVAAVPVRDSARVAAAVVSTEATVVVSVRDPSAEAAAPAATDRAR